MIDGHTHLEYGPLSKEYILQFVYKASERGIKTLHILDHTHRFKEFEEVYEPLKEFDKQKVWLENTSMKFKDSLDDYLKVIEQVRKLILPIEVKFGLEVCYTPETEDKLRDILQDHPFDFLVGAVHSVGNRLYDMGFSKEILWDLYSADEIYETYYDNLCSCIQSGLFTQLAHPDIIKLFQIYPTYDLTPTYEKLADLLVEYDMYAENNTGCFYRYKHPDLGINDEMLAIFKKKGVKMITVSDAHNPRDVAYGIQQVWKKTMG